MLIHKKKAYNELQYMKHIFILNMENIRYLWELN